MKTSTAAQGDQEAYHEDDAPRGGGGGGAVAAVRTLADLDAAVELPLHRVFLGPNSIEKIWLKYRLEKPLEFWLNISLQ